MVHPTEASGFKNVVCGITSPSGTEPVSAVVLTLTSPSISLPFQVLSLFQNVTYILFLAMRNFLQGLAMVYCFLRSSMIFFHGQKLPRCLKVRNVNFGLLFLTKAWTRHRNRNVVVGCQCLHLYLKGLMMVLLRVTLAVGAGDDVGWVILFLRSGEIGELTLAGFPPFRCCLRQVFFFLWKMSIYLCYSHEWRSCLAVMMANL